MADSMARDRAVRLDITVPSSKRAREEGGRAMFRSNGQKINVDTSGLSSGVEDSGDGSRGEYDGGWGQ